MAQAVRTKSSGRAKKTTASKKSTTSKKRRTEPQPSEYAKEAVSEWGNAVRYAVEAAGPVAKRTRQRLSDRWSDRLSHSRLRDQLNPAKTDKGGRVGDAADSMLEKLGTPGKLAAKASLGSRVVDRFLPDQADDSEESEAAQSEENEDADAQGAANDGPDSDGDRTTRAGTRSTVPEPAKTPAQVAPPPTGGRTGVEDPEEAEFEYERDYAARHDHLPPNAYPEITH
jgi:hypothetical protein